MSDSTTVRRRPRWLTAAIAAVLVVVLLLGLYWFMTDGPGARWLSPPGSTVAQFEGSANAITDSFRVRAGWSIHWDSSSESFALAIGGDRQFGTVITLDEPGSGVTSPTGAGTFHLEITALGPWQIRVAQGD